MMKAIGKRINGYIVEGDGPLSVRLAPDGPALVLRFAFVRRGAEEHILPTVVLDDWGTEIRKLKVYEWVRENGDLFPRAELFGYDMDGSEAQVFLRELELYMKFPCYVYENGGAAVADGRRVRAILWSDPVQLAPTEGVRPPDIPFVMRRASVRWWAVPLNTPAEWLPPHRQSA